MKTQELRKLIREEINKVLNEADDFGTKVVKDIQAERTAQQRKFIAWAKAAASKKNIKLDFGGETNVYISLNKLGQKDILSAELLQKWKNAKEGTEDYELAQGLRVVIDRYFK